MEETLKEIEQKIEQLEKEKIEYLEIDDKAGARRKGKQIEKLELKKEVLNLEKIKKELKAHKEVVKEYPELQNRVKKLLEQSK